MVSGGIVHFLEYSVVVRTLMMMDKQTTEDFVKDAFHNNNEVEWLQFPYKISDVDEKINSELLKDFTGELNFFIKQIYSFVLPI